MRLLHIAIVLFCKGYSKKDTNKKMIVAPNNIECYMASIKLCKHCKEDIDKFLKVCPHCQNKQFSI